MSKGPKKYYYIKSQLNGLYLDVENGVRSSGAPISPWEKNASDSQQFYDDPDTGFIHSKLNGFCMDTEGGRLVLTKYQNKPKQRWIRNGKVISKIDDPNIVLDICGEDKKPRARVIEYQAHYGKNQLWTYELA